MSKKTKIPDLRSTPDKVELDRVTQLLIECEELLNISFGEYIDLEEWDAVRIRGELEEMFPPSVFEQLFETKLGKGFILGAWYAQFVLGPANEGDELDEEIISLIGGNDDDGV